MRKLLILFSLFLAFGCANIKQIHTGDEPYVLLISFDGFRHDYVEKYKAPNFMAFIKEGVSAKSLISAFPSKTFPNHYSIVTGLYPEHHGLVDNTFLDSKLGLYKISDREAVANPSFYKGVPLWQLVQSHGMKSASFFWVGSETPVGGTYPTYWKPYDGTISNEDRVKTVMNWLKLPVAERPRFISLYFSMVDSAGHGYGPDSEETKAAVLEADALLGLIMNDLKNIDLDVNVIVVSDHGMLGIQPKPDHFLSEENLIKDIDLKNVVYANDGSQIHFYCDGPASKERVYKALKSRENHFTVYKNEEIPAKWHYRHNQRIGDILVVMDSGYYTFSRSQREAVLNAQRTIGVHGYRPELTAMQGIFYANGPQIAKGISIESFENIHIYPFLAGILNIKKLPAIDGKKEVLEKYLVK